MRAQGVTVIMGNYDEGVGFDMDDCGCAYRNREDDRRGHESLLWTRAHTTPEAKAYLRALPVNLRLNLAGQQLLLVHGSPRKTNEYFYADRPQSTFERIARLAGCDVLLFGHTHLPYKRTVARTLFVNAGAVGQPKDGDPRAGYVLLRLSRAPQAEFRRVPYDVQAASAGIRASGLPAHFADMLETGGLSVARAAAARRPA